jgi:hypothetical protein
MGDEGKSPQSEKAADRGYLWREKATRRWSDVDWAGKYSMGEVYMIATAFLVAGFFMGHFLWR